MLNHIAQLMVDSTESEIDRHKSEDVNGDPEEAVEWEDMSDKGQSPPHSGTDNDETFDASQLPSEHFHLDRKYKEMDPTEAKVMLQERTKELDAINTAAEMFNELDKPAEELIKTYVKQMPQWFQYPDVTEAKISVGNATAESRHYRRTDHPLIKELTSDEGTPVVIETVYTETRPPEDDGPWLDEEHDLLENIISFIEGYVSQWESEEKIQAQLERQQEVAENVEQGVEEVNQLSDTVAQSTEQISTHAQNSTESMGEVSDEVSNLSATVEEVASTADEVAQTSQQAEELAEEGRGEATEAINVMDNIDASTQEATDDITNLQTQLEEIDAIVEIMDDIADQTNLLALNASIEAARAGEAGDGFAVVADEVKDLAEESKSHANDIEQMVSEIQAESANAVASLEETTERVDSGITQVESSMAALQEIATAVEEASEGIQEVAGVTDDQAASTEEIAAMVDELVTQSNTLADEIEDVAAANEKQAAKVSDINDTVTELTEL